MKKTVSIITMVASVISALVALYLLAERKGWLDRFCTCDDYWCDDDCDCLDFCDDCECDCESDETPTEE